MAGTHALLRFADSNARRRLAVALTVAGATFVCQSASVSWQARAVLSWDLGAFAYLGLAWILIMHSDAHSTRRHALSQDQSAHIIFLCVVGAAFASIIAIGFMASTLKGLSGGSRVWHLALTVSALVSAWLLIQTVFAFHYARRYYAHPHGHTTAEAALTFPGGRDPDYLDFAYYATVVGMTSQVSDVTVTSRGMRRLTMIHGMLAFLFNIAVLALSINIMAGMI